MRKWLSSLLLLPFFLAPPLWAELKGLTIEAEKIGYDKAQHLINASGSAEVLYQDIQLQAGTIAYNTEVDHAQAAANFCLTYSGFSLEGEALAYQMVSREGAATNFRFNYSGLELSGRELNFSRELFNLKNAAFTTCNLAQPHYRVTASQVIVYPDIQWVVAYWGWFWLNGVPLVPVPTYIYDASATDPDRKNLPPFPEIGANEDDGSFIVERLAWHLRRELSGTYSLSYAGKKGFGLGGEANYIFNQQNKGLARLYWNGKDGFFGGVTHRYAFGGEVKKSKRELADFFYLPRNRQFVLELMLTHHERINYQRVSFLPNLKLSSRTGELLHPAAKYEFDLWAGQVEELNNCRLTRGGGRLKLYGDFPETTIGFITPSLAYDANYYSNSTHWLKPDFTLLINKGFNRDLALELGYTHYFYIDGSSPFNYELYRYRPADRLLSGFNFRLGETRGKIAASYFLDNWTPEDIDYSLFFKMHCYDLQATYRSLRGEFWLGVTLATI